MPVDLKSIAPDTTLPQSGFLFGADSQEASNPSVYPVANVKDALNSGIGTLASEPAITWDTAANPTATVTLTTNATLYASNFKAGGTYKLIVFQDATGGRTLSYDPNFKWPNDTIPTVSAGANAMTVFEFVSNGTYLYGTVSQAYDGSPAPTVSGLFARPANDYSTLSTLSSMPTGGAVSRNGQAMQYDSTGRLTWAPNNLLRYSQDFSTGAWTRNAVGTGVVPTVTGGFTAPDGSSTAQRIDLDLGATPSTALSRVFQAPTPAVTPVVNSVWLKTTDGSTKTLFMTADGANTSISVTGDWQRFSFRNAGATVYSQLQFGLSGASSGVGVTTSTSASILAWGAQVEAVTCQTSPRDYLPTTTAARFEPRFDVDPATGQAKGLLLEGARTNSVTALSTWTQINCSITGTTTTGPDGTAVTPLTVTTTAGTSFNVISTGSGSASGNTFSIYAKKGSGATDVNNFSLRNNTTATNLIVFSFNYDTGAISYTTGSNGASAQNVGNGWWRISISTVSGISAGNDLRVYVGGTGGTLTAGSFAYFFGPQLEAGTFASSLIPPAAAGTVSRLADTFTLSGYANRLIEAYWIEQETGVASSIPETVVTSGAVTINPPTFGWVTSLRAYQNAYAGDIATPSWIDNSGTNGNRMVTDSTGTLTWAPHNLLLNSETLSTQTVTVTSGATNILSFTGTGSITYSGAASGTLSGTGASNRVSVVLTMTTASLTLTVSGSVTQAQLERVTYQTQPRPWIATTGSAVFLPRYDFDASTTPASPRGMLIEEARTNLLTYSQDFDNAAWTPTNVTVTPNSAVAPDGTQTADTLTPSANSANIYRSGITLAAATVYTFSVWLRSASASNVSLNISMNGSGVTPNPTNGGVITVTPVWQRFTLQVTGNGGSANAIIGVLGAGGAWTANSAVYAWGAQVEAGTFATSYIPTTTGSVQRVADNVNGLTASISYNAVRGTFGVQFLTSYSGVADTPRYMLALDSNSNKRIVFLQTGADTARTFDGATTVTSTGDVTGAASRVFMAFDEGADARSIVANGGTVATGTVAVGFGTATNINIGRLGSNQLCGWVQSFAYYNSRLPDATLQKKSTLGASL